MNKMNFKTLYFEITHFCNQKCKHCYLDCGIQNELYELDTESIKDIIYRFKKQGGRFISITGGEPFARKDIFEILDYIDELDINFLIATNCLVMTEEKIKRLSKYKNLKNVFTSILGSTEEEHNYMANNRSFDHVLKCLKLFDIYGIKNYVQVTLGRRNINKAIDIADMLSEYNCTMKFTPIADIGIKNDKELEEELILPEEEYKEFSHVYDKIKSKYGERIEKHNLLSYEEIKSEIDYYKDKEFYSLTDMGVILRPNGEKSFSYDLNNPLSFGSALDEIEVKVDNKLYDYIKKLKEVDSIILDKSKGKEAVNYYHCQQVIIGEYYK